MTPSVATVFAISLSCSAAPARRDSLVRGYTTILSRAGGARLVAFRLVKVRPFDAAATLVNFAAQPGYVPYVEQATPRPGSAAADVDVDYTVEAPVHDVSYSVHDSITRIAGDEYFLGWRLLHSSFLSTVSGGASARPWQGDTSTTLLVYVASAPSKWFLQWLAKMLQATKACVGCARRSMPSPRTWNRKRQRVAPTSGPGSRACSADPDWQ